MSRDEEGLTRLLYSVFFKLASFDPDEMWPDILYHYTTAAGLHGIISEGTLWGTNYGYLNDSSELSYGRSVAHGVISDRLVSESNKHVRALFKRASDGLVKTADAIDFYVTCFCQASGERAANDRLSHWRGYGGSSGSCCIAFDAQALYDRAKILDHHSGTVVYDQGRQRRKVTLALDAARSKLLEGRVSNRAFSEAIAGILIQKLLAEACLFKHYGFNEENEWRIVHFARDASSLQFQPREGLLTPYVHMVVASGDPPALPITEITAGPSRIGALAKKSVELLLKRYSYSGVDVRESTIPAPNLSR